MESFVNGTPKQENVSQLSLMECCVPSITWNMKLDQQRRNKRMRPKTETKMSYNLGDGYELSIVDIAEKMFLNHKTVSTTEKKAMQKFREGLAQRGIDIKDLLP